MLCRFYTRLLLVVYEFEREIKFVCSIADHTDVCLYNILNVRLSYTVVMETMVTSLHPPLCFLTHVQQYVNRVRIKGAALD